MSAAFTPGPWDWWDDGKIVRVTEGAEQHHVCEVTSPSDARLIAAAPELYGQLESAQTDLDLLRRAIEENDPKAELLIRVTDLWKRNDAALAKARGDTPNPSTDTQGQSV